MNTSVIDHGPAAQIDMLRELVNDHKTALTRYTASIIGDRGRAEDIVQETLLRAWLRPPVLAQAHSARPWLFTVARNLVIDEMRSARHRREVKTDAPPERPHVGPDQYDRVIDARVIADALGTLTESHRAVIVASYYRGMSTAAIADELDLSVGTVKSRMHYGMKKLRVALEEAGVTTAHAAVAARTRIGAPVAART